MAVWKAKKTGWIDCPILLKAHCTRVGFTGFLSGQFTTLAIVVHRPDKRLTNPNCFTNSSTFESSKKKRKMVVVN